MYSYSLCGCSSVRVFLNLYVKYLFRDIELLLVVLWASVMSANKREVMKLPHHERADVCTSRAKYRQGRKFTAIKVYTVNDESQHLLICGVPALGLQDELRRLCSRYGDVKSLVFVPKYEQEEFTEAYHVQYTRIQSARYAKRHLDDRAYFGGVLHVCYAPEMESVDETRTKLIQRRKDIAKRIQRPGELSAVPSVPKQYNRQRKHPALPLTADRLSTLPENAKCIWQGIPCEIDPRKKSLGPVKPAPFYGPEKPDDKWLQAGVKGRMTIPHVPKSLACTSNTGAQESGTTPEINSNVANKVQISSPVLRFIPHQVNQRKRILFTKGSEVVNKKSESSEASAESLSVEETILSVRKRIRSVGVPNNLTVLE